MKSCPTLLTLAICSLFSYDTLADDTTPTTVCVFDDGIEYAEGDPLGDSFVNRCGDSQEWPCFCYPELRFQAFCPYCGFSDGAGTLHCARDGETISFQDGSIVRKCFCAFDAEDPSAEPIRNCTTEGGNSPVDSPTDGPQSVDGQCVLPDAEGNMVEIDNGDSFGELIEGACGPALEWPSYCQVTDDEGNFDISYPYCVYDNVSMDESSTGILCAMDGEIISYSDENGVELMCNCTITADGIPEPECNNESPVSPPTTDAPISTPDTQATPAPIQPASAFSMTTSRWTVRLLPLVFGLKLVL
jgi:hypothetical protein